MKTDALHFARTTHRTWRANDGGSAGMAYRTKPLIESLKTERNGSLGCQDGRQSRKTFATAEPLGGVHSPPR